MNKIVGVVKQQKIRANLNLSPKITAKLNFKVVKVQGEIYDGDYEVVPKVESDVLLETTDKVMIRDVTVYKIPYEEVENIKQGKTVTIGGY